MPRIYSSFLRGAGAFLGSSGDLLKRLLREASNRTEGSLSDRLIAVSTGNIRSILYNGHSLVSLYRKFSPVWNKIADNPVPEILNLLADQEMTALIEGNQTFFADLIEDLILSRINPSIKEKKKIRADVDELVRKLSNLSKNVREIIVRHNLRSQEDIQAKLAELVSDKEADLYQNISSLIESGFNLVQHNPAMISEVIYLNILSPADKLHKAKYQEKVLSVLRSIPDDKKADVGSYFARFRFPESRGALLDDYVETYMHNKSLEGIDFKHMSFDQYNFAGFKFRFSQFKDTTFSNSKIVNCDFRYAIFTDSINIIDCEIDAATFKTMLPSLRQAQANGVNMNLRFNVIGHVESLDLRGIKASGIRILDGSINVTRSRDDHMIASSANEVAERRRVHSFLEANHAKITEMVKAIHPRNQNITHLIDEFESILYESAKDLDEVSKSVLLEILNNDVEARNAFISSCLNGLERDVRFEHVSRDWLMRSRVEVKLKQESNIKTKFVKYLSDIRNDSRYQFVVKCGERTNGASKQDVIRDDARKLAVQNIIMLISHDSVRELLHYDSELKANMFGIILRNLVEYLLPPFLKPMVYPQTRLGKVLKSRTPIEFIKILFKIITNYRSIKSNIISLLPVLDDINLGKVWKTPEETKKAQINLVKSIVSNKMLRKTSILFDRRGKPLRDANGELIPNENIVDLLYSTMEIFSDKQDIRELLKYSSDILEILERCECIDIYEKILYLSDPVMQKAELLKIIDKVSIDDFRKLQKGLDKTRPLIEKIVSAYNASSQKAEDKTKRYQFPHTGTMKWMDRVFALMATSKTGEVVDIGKRVYRGKITDFAYGMFTGEEAHNVEISNIKAKHFNATSTVFEYVKFQNCKLSGCKKENRDAFLFLGANFDHAKFKGGAFEQVQIANSYFGYTEFDQHTIKKTNLKGAIFTSVIFRNGVIDDTDMRASDCVESVFEKSEIKNVIFDDAKLEKASFWESRLSNVSFRNATMTGVNFTGATLEDCDLTGVDLTEVNLDNIEIVGTIKVSRGCVTRSQIELLRRKAGDNLKIVSDPSRARGKHSKKLLDQPMMPGMIRATDVGSGG